MEKLNIKKLEVIPLVEKLYCNNCKDTEMCKSNAMLMTYPPQYSYYCPNCDYRVSSMVSFPHISYREKEE